MRCDLVNQRQQLVSVVSLTCPRWNIGFQRIVSGPDDDSKCNGSQGRKTRFLKTDQEEFMKLPKQHALALTLVIALALPGGLAAQKAPQTRHVSNYQVFTLPNTLGGTASGANAINDLGWAMGFAASPTNTTGESPRDPQICPTISSRASRSSAFRWQRPARAWCTQAVEAVPEP